MKREEINAMNRPPKATSRTKEIVLTVFGVLLIVSFIVLYLPRFLGIGSLPFAIRYLFYELSPEWAIAANAAIFILFLVFLPYRTGVEWRTKSTFSAFMLALMAEMFGFPLLLYILSPLMKFSYYERHPGGWLNNPMIFGWPGAVIGSWLTLIGMVLVFLGWRQIYRAEGLVTTGLYRHVRHPQYTGFFFIITGWLLHWETTLTLIMYPILLVMYFLLARREEKDLAKKFGDEYRAYCKRTSMFFPLPWKMKLKPLEMKGE